MIKIIYDTNKFINDVNDVTRFSKGVFNAFHLLDSKFGLEDTEFILKMPHEKNARYSFFSSDLESFILILKIDPIHKILQARVCKPEDEKNCIDILTSNIIRITPEELMGCISKATEKLYDIDLLSKKTRKERKELMQIRKEKNYPNK